VKRPAAFALLLLVLLGVWGSAAGRGGQRTATPGVPGPAVGQLAPPFSLPAAGGGTVTLAALRGRPLLLNFWATWCPDCRAELTALGRVRAAEGGRAAVVGVDVQQAAGPVRLFLAQQGVGWPVVLDAQGQLAAEYGVEDLPTTFFIDARGVIRRIYTGPLSVGRAERYLAAAGA
jgi:cytochrome c biogenesis protein CcmG/thiol:disulfide interchange protein DsbE